MTPKDVHLLPQEPVNMFCYMPKGNGDCRKIKFANQLTLKQRDHPRLSEWAQGNHRVLTRGREKQKRKSQKDGGIRRTWPDLLALMMEDGAKDAGSHQKLGKARTQNLPQGLQRGMLPCEHPILAQRDLLNCGTVGYYICVVSRH